MIDSECTRPTKIIQKTQLSSRMLHTIFKKTLVLVVLDESSKYSAHEVYNRTYIPVSDPLRIIDFTEKY